MYWQRVKRTILARFTLFFFTQSLSRTRVFTFQKIILTTYLCIIDKAYLTTILQVSVVCLPLSTFTTYKPAGKSDVFNV